MKARGVATAAEILANDIKFDANGVPHPRHVDLVNWPADKHARKIIQEKIARTMSLSIRPR
jgi:hypothetical protein